MKDDKRARNRENNFSEKPRRGDKFGENDEFDEFDANDKTTRRIRNALNAARASLPADFFETRLKKALDESPDWARFEQKYAASFAVRPGAFRETRRGKRALWLGVGGAAVALVAALFVGWSVGVGARGGGQNGDLASAERNDAPRAESENAENATNGSTEKNERASDDFVFRMPLSSGVAAVAASNRSEEDFWATFPVAQADLRTLSGEFSRFCWKLDIKIDKFGGDAEFLLKDATPEKARELAAWFREKAEANAMKFSFENDEATENLTSETTGWRTSQAVDRWLETSENDEEGGRAQNLRVSFVEPENVDGEQGGTLK